MKNIKAIIFDMDGVIFNTEKLYFDTWEKIFKKYGYKITIDEYTSVMGIGRDNVKKRFKEIYGQNIPIEHMYKEKDMEVLSAIENNRVELKDNVLYILEKLKTSKYKVGLATSAKRIRVEKQLKGAGIMELFNFIICGDEIKNPKPNPEIFLTAAKKMNVNPSECIVVEDSLSGINAAYNAKMEVVHIPDLKDYYNELKDKVNFKIYNIIELENIL